MRAQSMPLMDVRARLQAGGPAEDARCLVMEDRTGPHIARRWPSVNMTTAVDGGNVPRLTVLADFHTVNMYMKLLLHLFANMYNYVCIFIEHDFDCLQICNLKI